ncbi:hypothetical protein MUN89_19580 [Halobacillus salinarum]|uniref:Uncharacterized protein n=1 Tax=Halobacillus salinarum TaxID=2932257 RepID=A0ABY4EK82_9BACI|nr:hypothetical protein [Halobacillus salinarum]UOQ44039.1 hypothetical protein MUN89_19580 [Halobacillus salinarum]
MDIKFFAQEINLPHFKVNTAGLGCTISFGQNKITRKVVSNKEQEGFGEQLADGVVMDDCISIIHDGDGVDGGG